MVVQGHCNKLCWASGRWQKVCQQAKDSTGLLSNADLDQAKRQPKNPSLQIIQKSELVPALFVDELSWESLGPPTSVRVTPRLKEVTSLGK